MTLQKSCKFNIRRLFWHVKFAWKFLAETGKSQAKVGQKSCFFRHIPLRTSGADKLRTIVYFAYFFLLPSCSLNVLLIGIRGIGVWIIIKGYIIKQFLKVMLCIRFRNFLYYLYHLLKTFSLKILDSRWISFWWSGRYYSALVKIRRCETFFISFILYWWRSVEFWLV